MSEIRELPVKIKVTLDQYNELAKLSKNEWQEICDKLVKDLELP